MWRLCNCALSILLLCCASSRGAALFVVTEVYVGVTGDDGTDDWFELTNFGDQPGDTGTLFFEDNSRDSTRADQLSSLILSPGESAVFLITGNFEVEAVDFWTVWGGSVRLGMVDGAGLGQNDEINLFDSNAADAVLLFRLSISGSHDISRATFVYDQAGELSASIAGVAGAYESAEFFNDDLGDPDDMISLVGSPGVIPEPQGALLLVAALFFYGARRRG